MQNYASDAVTISAMSLRRAISMANGLGLPVVHDIGEGFDYLSVPDVIPQSPYDDFILARWSLALGEAGGWTVADAGRWDCLDVQTPPSVTVYATLSEALKAIHEARAAALLAAA